MSNVVIYKLKDHPNAGLFIPIIAKWSMKCWGKFLPEKTLDDWERGIGASIYHNEHLPLRLVAVDLDDQSAGNDHGLVGFINIKMNDMEGRYPDFNPWISSLFTKDGYEEKLVNEELVENACEILKHYGWPTVYVFTHYLGRKAFYEKMDFALLKEEQYRWAPIYLFKKALN
jgi:hypothetical protein